MTTRGLRAGDRQRDDGIERHSASLEMIRDRCAWNGSPVPDGGKLSDNPCGDQAWVSRWR
jgi:hypothetical protein